MKKRFLLQLTALLFALSLTAQKNNSRPAVDAAADKIEAQTIADHLRSLGIEVREGVGKTGVVGILKGALPGPVIGLRAAAMQREIHRRMRRTVTKIAESSGMEAQPHYIKYLTFILYN